MSLGVGRGMLLDARRDLLGKWDRLRDTWDDANADAFGTRYVEPVDRHVRQSAEAIEKLSSIVERAKAACE